MLWWHLALRWCSPHHLCGRGWPLESRLLSLCTLCWGPNLKTSKIRVSLPQLGIVQGRAVLYIQYSRSALLLQSCWEFKLLLPHAPNDRNRTVTSKPGHQINILLSRKTNCHDHAVRAGSRAAGAHPVCFFLLNTGYKWVLSDYLCEYEVSHSWRPWNIDEAEGCVTCGGNQVRRAFHGFQRRDPHSTDRARTWRDFNTHTHTHTRTNDKETFFCVAETLPENSHQLITK